MRRYWVSWYARYCLGCQHIVYPIQVWQTQFVNDDFCEHGFSFVTFCAIIDTDKTEKEVFDILAKYTPDIKPRFFEEKDLDYTPSIERFGDFLNETNLEFDNFAINSINKK